MNGPLRVLIVEDSAIDAELALAQLKGANLAVEARRVQTAGDYRRELEQFRPQVILSDFSMPSFNGLKALEISREFYPHIPFIFVSGTIGEESAIQALKNGATDYVLKSNLLRLPSAVEKAVEGTEERAEQLRIQRELQQMHDHLRDTLSSLGEVVWSVALPSWELLYVSPSITDVYGLAAEDFLQDHLPWGGLIDPDDRERVAQEWERAATAGTFNYKHYIVLPNRETHRVRNRGRYAVDATGRSVRIDGVTRDITGRRTQNEKTMRVNQILIKILRQLISGKRHHVSQRLVNLLARCPKDSVDPLPHEQLSGRELQILLLIGDGRSAKQIAGDLAISINTVNTHRARILKKMGMRTNAALIRYAVEHGLVE